MTGTALASTNEGRATIAYGRLELTVVLALYAIPLMRHPESGGLLDGIDLAIHETGHLVFGIFGEVIGVAGGTLFQLIVPVTFVLYFAKRGDRHAATVPLWWVAQNLWNISVYVRDARVQELPLVGGGEHDWAYLLGRFGLLAHDQGIGRGVHAFGTLLCIAAVATGIKFALEGQPTKDTADRTAELMGRLLDHRRNGPTAQPMKVAVDGSGTESFEIGTDRIVVRRLAGDDDA